MCNEYHQRIKRGEIVDQFTHLRIPIRWADAEPNRDLDKPLRPTNRATVIRPVDTADPSAGVEGLEMRWWLVPFFHKGALKDWKAMCTNARLETVETTAAFREAYKRRRCLVPVSSFIEYDEPPGWKKGAPKRRWEITWGDELRFFAGLWDKAHPADMPDGLESFTFVTGPAGPDFSSPFPDTGKGLHARQARVLTLAQGMDWLKLDGPGKAMLEPDAAAGSFTFSERARPAETA